MPDWIIDSHLVSISIRPKSASDPTLYYDYYRPDGLRRRKSLQTTDPALALLGLQALRPIIEADVRDGAVGPAAQAPNPRIAELVTYYVDTYLPAKAAAPRTITKARQVLGEFQLYLAGRHIGRVQQLTRTHVDEHVADLRSRGKSAKSIADRLGLIRACLNANVEADRLEASPIRKWLMPTASDPEIDPLTPKQLTKVLATVEERRPDLYPIVAWIALTGNRPSDAVSLRWRQVDTQAGVVSRTHVKVKKLSSYQVSPAALQILRSQEHNRKHDGLVFLQPDGAPYTVNVLYRAFTRCLQAKPAFERPVNLKDLRHTFGYTMVNLVRCPLPVVQVLMGHRLIETTLKYVRPGNAAEDLAAFDKLLKTQAP